MNKLEKFKDWWNNSYEKIEGYAVYLFYDDTCPDLYLRYEDRENHVYVNTSDDWGEVCIEGFTYAELEPIFYPEEYLARVEAENKKKLEVEKYKCPICGYALGDCQCLFSGSAHPDRDDRIRVVLDHLYLFNKEQIKHIIDLQSIWQIGYSDEKLNNILEDLKRGK